MEDSQYYQDEAAKTWELLSHAAEWATTKLISGEQFSLIGFSERSDGEIIQHLIFATSDVEMLSKAKAALKLGKTVRFALIGEGGVGSNIGYKRALLAYFQDNSFDLPFCMFRGYERDRVNPETITHEESWTIAQQLDESWL